MKNFDELKNLGLETMTDSTSIATASRDASIFQVNPEAVIYPKNSEEIKKLAAWVTQNKSSDPSLSITARSGGTDMSGGPLNESIILDFTKYFNQIGQVSDGLATTQPGVYYRDFEKATLSTGQLMPAYTASREICTVGGMVANNSGGEKSLAYGKTERYVKKLKTVLSDGDEYVFEPMTLAGLEEKKSQQNFEGQIYRSVYDLIESNYDLIQKSKPDVSKNSAGYYLWNVWDRKVFDLTKLLVGSQGTLGLVTEIDFSLIKPKKYSKILVIFLNSLDPLGEIVNEVLKFNPESFESFDDHTFKIAMKFLPQLFDQVGSNLFSLFFKFLPEIGMVISGGVPKLILIAEFTSNEDVEAHNRMKQAQEAMARFKVKTHLVETISEAEKYWKIRRESFNLLRKHAGKQHSAPFIDDIVVHPSQLPQFLPQLNNLIGQYKGLTYTIAGHAGDANFHVIPLMDFRLPENRRAIPELSEKVYDLVASMHGSITGEHNDGIVRTPYLPKMFSPEMIDLFEKTKNIFDPLNIFNPGKKVHGSKEYMLNHIISE